MTRAVSAASQPQGRTVSASRRILLAASTGGSGLARPTGALPRRGGGAGTRYQ